MRRMERTSEVRIQSEQGIMPAYCAVPTTPPPWPGVVVIHDFTGMSHDLRALTGWQTRAFSPWPRTYTTGGAG